MENADPHKIIPYLPYGLVVQLTPNTICKLTLEETDNDSISIGALFRFPFKPYLHPLSDLNKLGDENTPINEHSINLLISEKFNLEYGVFSHYQGEIDFVREGDPYTRYDTDKEIPFKVFEAVREELLKGHYDIYNLIDAGLAIDKNTL